MRTNIDATFLLLFVNIFRSRSLLHRVENKNINYPPPHRVRFFKFQTSTKTRTPRISFFFKNQNPPLPRMICFDRPFERIDSSNGTISRTEHPSNGSIRRTRRPARRIDPLGRSTRSADGPVRRNNPVSVWYRWTEWPVQRIDSSNGSTRWTEQPVRRIELFSGSTRRSERTVQRIDLSKGSSCQVVQTIKQNVFVFRWQPCCWCENVKREDVGFLIIINIISVHTTLSFFKRQHENNKS